MATPATVAPILAGAGTVLQIFGLVSGARAQQEAAEANAAQAERNARLVREAGRRQIKGVERGQKAFRGEQIAAIGKAGVTQAGAPSRVLREAEAVTRMDIEAIKRATTAQELDFIQTARQERRFGKGALKTAAFGIGATLLTGGARLAETLGDSGGGLTFSTATAGGAPGGPTGAPGTITRKRRFF